MGPQNIIVIYKKSIYELYSQSPNPEIQRFLRENPEDGERMKQSHETQQHTLNQVVDILEKKKFRHTLRYRADLEPLKGFDLVLSVGGDGTFLEVSHYVEETPILGVNSDTNGSIGYYCAATVQNFSEVIGNLSVYPQTKLNRLQLVKDGKRIDELVLNEVLFAHPNPAANARYEYKINEEQKLNPRNGKTLHKNSGLIVCTAAGSTAWIHEMGGKVMPLDSLLLQYHERDFRDSGFEFAQEIELRSLTREGKIYLDGEHLHYDLRLGSVLKIESGTSLNLVGDLQKKRERLSS